MDSSTHRFLGRLVCPISFNADQSLPPPSFPFLAEGIGTIAEPGLLDRLSGIDAIERTGLGWRVLEAAYSDRVALLSGLALGLLVIRTRWTKDFLKGSITLISSAWLSLSSVARGILRGNTSLGPE